LLRPDKSGRPARAARPHTGKWRESPATFRKPPKPGACRSRRAHRVHDAAGSQEQQALKKACVRAWNSAAVTANRGRPDHRGVAEGEKHEPQWLRSSSQDALQVCCVRAMSARAGAVEPPTAENKRMSRRAIRTAECSGHEYNAGRPSVAGVDQGATGLPFPSSRARTWSGTETTAGASPGIAATQAVVVFRVEFGARKKTVDEIDAESTIRPRIRMPSIRARRRFRVTRNACGPREAAAGRGNSARSAG